MLYITFKQHIINNINIFLSSLYMWFLFLYIFKVVYHQCKNAKETRTKSCKDTH